MKMRIIFLLIILFTYAAFPQETNRIVVDERSGRPMLVGPTTTDAFSDSSFAWWYDSQYDMYEIDTVLADQFSERLAETYIYIVMGTWCGDSRREVPRFMKILEYSGYPDEKLVIINVDRSMTAEGVDVEKFDIRYVPTFIFYSGETEIGRIIESPEDTLEEDMSEILNE
jgi:thiol-disulfide isomerase/thioredoxin